MSKRNGRYRLEPVLIDVAKLLQNDERLRNDDLALIFKYWKLVDGADVTQPEQLLTSPLTIIRVRQKLQSDGYLLPTDPIVIKVRRKREVKVKKWLGDYTLTVDAFKRLLSKK